MRDYEQVRWESGCLRGNLGTLRRELTERTDASFAEDVCAIGKDPGPLNVCLARASGPSYNDYQASRVVARFLHLARDAQPRRPADEVVHSLTPLLGWDHGWSPLVCGLDELGRSASALGETLGRPSADGMGAYVEAIWLIGLLGLVCPASDRRQCLDALFSELPPSDGALPAPPAIGSLVRRRIGDLCESVTGRRGLPPGGRRQELWDLALISACRHKWLRGGQPEVYGRLLSYVADGGSWPPPWPENEELRQRAADRGCSGFWKAVEPVPYSRPFAHQVEFLEDPLELLNIANAFDTCARLNGPEERHVLAYAANANYRIAAVRASDGRILARRAIGLRITAEPGVLDSLSYPPCHTTSREAIDSFLLKQLLQEARLDPIDPDEGRGVERTVVPPYNTGWIRWGHSQGHAACGR